MRRSCRLFCALWLVVSGCAGVPARVESRASPREARAVVLVVDGAGGYQNTPRAIAEVVDEDRLPLCVRGIVWTHGEGRWLIDQVDQPWSTYEGQRLAEEICAYRRCYPNLPIYLAAYSAG